MENGKAAKRDILMEKAKVIIYGEKGVEKAIPVLFNPAEYNISRSVNYAKLSIPGTDSPIMQFINGGETSLSLTLYFDTQNDYAHKTSDDVRICMQPILSALWIDGKLHAPPEAAFSWGSCFFKGVITDAKQSFTMFLPSGIPVRAKLDITFTSNEDTEDARKKSPTESPNRTKARRAEKGAQLWRIADAEYGNPKYWRMIADFNKIYNPRKLPEGRLLQLPPLKEL